MAFFRAAFAALLVSTIIYLIAIQYWLPTAIPPVRTEHHNIGLEIPSVGIGTWLSDKDKVTHTVEFALKSGYNHVDAALIYSLSTLMLRQRIMQS